MHWSDAVILGLIVGGTYIGMKRGVVLEVSDWVMGIVSFTLAFRAYRPLAKALKAGFLHGWTQSWVDWFSFLFFLVPSLILILTVGLHFDRLSREQERIPEEIRKFGGLAVAVVKYIVLSCLFVGWFPTTGGLTTADARDFRNAMMVNLMRHLNPPAAGVVRVVAPTDLADKFIEEMNKH